MVSKTIKISEKNYLWLLNLASELQRKRKRLVSFDEALEELKEGKGDNNVVALAGSWKMSEKESAKMVNEIYKERKVTSRRL